MDRVSKFIDLSFGKHICIGLTVRLVFILYGNIHDRFSVVPYTDVDYKVFTDAARHLVEGNSPYLRHTYRYSPLIAYLMMPNIIVGREFGKILFSVFDIFLAAAVKSLVERQLGVAKYASVTAKYCALSWLYNPLSIGISTRGNADSFPCFLIVLSIYFLQSNVFKNSITNIVLSGFFLGSAIHLRLYPLAFTFPMYLSLGKYKINRNTPIKEGLVSLLPNKNQMILAFSCVTSLLFITYAMYLRYGYEFLFETYIYHLLRKDTRHNFSILFYYTYLTKDQMSFDIVKILAQVSKCVLLFLLSLNYGCDPKTLPFAMFAQAVVLVAYNSVMTSQYFIWFLSLLPLVLKDFKMEPGKIVYLVFLWIATQCAWLFFAYQLEFKCRQVFMLIWCQSIMFYGSNVFILTQLIKYYRPGYAFGINESGKGIKEK